LAVDTVNSGKVHSLKLQHVRQSQNCLQSLQRPKHQKKLADLKPIRKSEQPSDSESEEEGTTGGD